MSTRTVPGEQALAAALESAAKRERPRWVLRGSAASFLEQGDDSPSDPAAAIEASAHIDAAKWFETRREAALAELTRDRSDVEFIGTWSGGAPAERTEFTVHCDLFSGEPVADALVQAIDVEHAWQIPAVLGFGGWNDCPADDVQCAVWRYWQKTYDAHIVAITHDVIEAVVRRPPQTREDAERLAWEHYLFCADTIEQGAQTVRDLAERLQTSGSWYFWWD